MDSAERLRRKNAFDGSLVMGVDRLNRESGRDRHQSSSWDFLVDPATGLLKANLARDRGCPVCGGRFTEPLFVKDGFPHGRCPDCGLLYVNPVLRDDAVLRHYHHERTWVQVLDSGPQVRLDRLKYEYGLDLCRPWLAGREVLDVGTGTGLFLNTARDHGFKAMGLELNDLGVARLREAGFEVIDRPLEEAGLESDCFDLITLWEVLEHIVEPGRLLLEISRIIRPQGLLLVLVPNTDSLVTRLLHEKSATFGGHSHVNFFNVSTLGRLLDQSGFQIVEAETVITELGTINNHLALEDPYFGRAEPVLDFLSPDLIHDRMLGSKLLVLARPKANQESGA